MADPKGQLLCIVNMEAEVVGYRNLYDPGDEWVKICGCEECPEESQRRCCGKCGHRMAKGCSWHVEKGDLTTGKPFVCVVRPLPSHAHSFCQQEYRCVEGRYFGRIRRARDRRDLLREPDGTIVDLVK
jgi:hypothetical protein